jgi:hypothetical protein
MHQPDIIVLFLVEVVPQITCSVFFLLEVKLQIVAVGFKYLDGSLIGKLD